MIIHGKERCVLEGIGSAVIFYSGYVLAALAVWILARCAVSMLQTKYDPEIWGYIELPGGKNLAIHHWECILGRSSAADIVLEDGTVARSHAAIQRDDRGEWTITDLATSAGTWVNGEKITETAPIRSGDQLRLGKTHIRFHSLTDTQRQALHSKRVEPGHKIRPTTTLLLLGAFQLLVLAQNLINAAPEHRFPIALAFVFLIALEWGAYFMVRSYSVRGFEPETVALFLTTVGFSVAATSTPGDMVKQSLLFLAALALFFALGLWLRDLRRVRSIRWFMALAALGFLALNLLLSERIWGAKNWLSIAGQSLQPSEFVKIAYVYAGAATLDRLFRRRNLILFIAFSAVCVGALAVMGDFGTALVFFTCFLVISFLRSGSFATVFLALGGAALAAVLVLAVKPYVAARFATWGHAWDDPLGAGFQQVRAMSATAAGGLFGRGAGGGWLKDVVAANTDLVFAVVCEELGLIVGVCCVLAILLLAFFSVRSAATGRSSFYLIASCATVTIFMAQVALNVFGSLDLLPFTGVTFPFVSRGGSSLISCWAMMAYIMAGDTRQSGSFALRTTFGQRLAKKPAAKKAPAPAKKAPAKKVAPSKTSPGKKPAAKKPAPPKTSAPARKRTAAPKRGTGKGAAK